MREIAQSLMWGVQKLSKCHLLLLLVKLVLEQGSCAHCAPKVGDCPSTSDGVQALACDGAEHGCVLLSEWGCSQREEGNSPISLPDSLVGKSTHCTTGARSV